MALQYNSTERSSSWNSAIARPQPRRNYDVSGVGIAPQRVGRASDRPSESVSRTPTLLLRAVRRQQATEHAVDVPQAMQQLRAAAHAVHHGCDRVVLLQHQRPPQQMLVCGQSVARRRTLQSQPLQCLRHAPHHHRHSAAVLRNASHPRYSRRTQKKRRDVLSHCG
jgi:hypothetical protein